MNELTYRLNAVGETDRCRIKELRGQYHRMWYAFWRPFILGPIVGIILTPIILPFVIHYLTFDGPTIAFLCVLLLTAVTVVMMCFNRDRMVGEVEMTVWLVNKPGYKECLALMYGTDPIVARKLQRMIRNNSAA